VSFPKPLAVSINDLYDAFASVPRPVTIPYCSHCVYDAEITDLMSARPLRDIPAEVLQPYTSNLVVSTAGSPDDARYFTPRILELALDRRERKAWPDLTAICEYLGPAGANWPQRERDAIRDLLHSAWLDRITTDSEPWEPDVMELLRAIAHATADVSPLLTLWSNSLEQPWAAGHLAVLAQGSERVGDTWRPNGTWPHGCDTHIGTWTGTEELRDFARARYDATPDDPDALILISSLVWYLGMD